MAIRYIDFTQSTGTLTGTWTFTNASASVTGSGGDAQTELADGDYIRMSDGTQWYKVDGEPPGADEITIDPVFQQATHTDDAGASLYNSEDGTTNPDSYPDAGHEAFCHPNQYTTDEVRAAGDTGKMRANQTHLMAGVDITMDEDGTANSHITLKGCDSVDDPWSDGSDVLPIIDFGAGNFHFNLVGDNFWKLERLDITNSTDGAGSLQPYNCVGLIVKDCVIHGNTSCAIRTIDAACYEIINCTFYDNGSVSSKSHIAHSGQGVILIKDCVFYGGASGTDYGLRVEGPAIYLESCTFGVSGAPNNEHNNADIFLDFGGRVYGRNVKLGSTIEVSLGNSAQYAFVTLEDDEQTHLAFRAWHWNGNLSRTTAVNRSGEGGSSWSMLGEPNSSCGSEQALHLMGKWLKGVPIYLEGTEQTITVWAYATSWASLPTVSQFVVEIEHYEGAADWNIDTTSDTFAANDQWEGFSITLTPGAAGPGYLRVSLKDYEDGTEKIYIDPKPAIT